MAKITRAERERRLGFARQEAGRAWCGRHTGKIEMDIRLANEFARILAEHMYKAHLGCATTRELLAEIAARSDLEYRTVGDGI